MGSLFGPGRVRFWHSLVFCCCCFSVGSLFHSVIFFAFTFFFYIFSIISSSLSLSFDLLHIKSRTYCTQLSALAGWLFYNGFCMECLLINPKLVFTFFCISRKVNSCFFCVCFFYFLLNCLLLLLSLSFFASLADLSLSPSLSLFSLFFFFCFCCLTIVSRARESVSPEIGGLLSPLPKRGRNAHTHSHAHTRNHRTQCNIGNIAEGDHSSG